VGLLEKLLNRFHVDPVLQRAVQREWGGDTAGAIEELETAVTTGKPTPVRLRALASMLLSCNRFDEALTYSAQALALAPHRPELIVNHSRVLRRAGRYDEALPLISGQYSKDKKNLFVAMEYCKLLVDMGQGTEALVVFEETERWFKPLAQRPDMERNGMSQAYREAKAKLRHGWKQ
jgi:Flp pilus assembly protein TadD